MTKSGYVYILASRRNGTLYVGVTSELNRRVLEHKNKKTKCFTSKYDVTQLVYCETYDDIEVAITREKAMKEWKRAWKIKRIEEYNPQWRDLFDEYAQ